MIRSMTGFGRGEASDELRKITVELKSVNHRYLDVNVRMPRQLNALEPSLRALIKQNISRGKVDVYVSCEDLSEREVSVRYNAGIAREYLDHLETMAIDLCLDDDIRVSTLSHYPEVLTMEEAPLDEAAIQPLVEQAFTRALEGFVAAREREGAELAADLEQKLAHMQENVARVTEREPQIVEDYRKKLEEKVWELLDNAQLDEGRVAAETVLFADKICTDEETVRLQAHITSMRETIAAGEDVGRKLDFLAQEMNREANTILSKSNDLETSNIAIELKTEIEKVREQIQNIE